MRASWQAVVFLIALILLLPWPVEVLGEESEDGALSGMVRDARTRKPIARADVMVVGSWAEAVTGPDGTYRVRRIPIGRYRVVFSGPGYERRVFEDVQILPGEETPLFAELGRESLGVEECPREWQEARGISQADEASVREAADSANAFAWQLFEVLSRTEGNLVFSPFSVSVAMAMTSAGAAGGTRDEMRSALHLPSDEGRLHLAWEELLGDLSRGAETERHRLNVASRLWGQEGHAFLDAFLVITCVRYGAQLGTLDFERKPEESRQTINKWVADKTEGSIPDLIPLGAITPVTRLVLANAVYFFGLWEDPFKKAMTKDEEFFLSETDSVLVPMMHATSGFRYAEVAEANLQLLEMPYQSAEISMIIALPRDRGGIEDVEKGIDEARLLEWIKELRRTNVRVHFPRFRVQSDLALKEALSDLGMTSAFAPGTADLSRMDGTRDLFISEIYHKSFVEVTEEGTEAAAATGEVVWAGEIVPLGAAPPPLFNANHPFLFLIRDRVTGSILFIARVMDPSTM